ncbi:hypothetical protein GPALN_004494 [Globodera pallida]|nr:hypothetical protein GPALN_004494 [Globodera pallida]
MACGSSPPVLYFCNAKYRSVFHTQFGHQAIHARIAYSLAFCHYLRQIWGCRSLNTLVDIVMTIDSGKYRQHQELNKNCKADKLHKISIQKISFYDLYMNNGMVPIEIVTSGVVAMICCVGIGLNSCLVYVTIKTK